MNSDDVLHQHPFVAIDKSTSLNLDELAKIPNLGALLSSLIELLGM